MHNSYARNKLHNNQFQDCEWKLLCFRHKSNALWLDYGHHGSAPFIYTDRAIVIFSAIKKYNNNIGYLKRFPPLNLLTCSYVDSTWHTEYYLLSLSDKLSCYTR